MSDEPIYLDYNATTPIDPRVADAMMPYLREHYGNPSSGHRRGRTCRAAVDRARGQVAALLGCTEAEVLFTSGGTESNNMVILGAFEARRGRGRHIITSAVEHPAVSEPCNCVFLVEHRGAEVTEAPVDAHGRVDLEAVKAALRPDTILVSIMHANNEVGTLQPLAEIAAAARAAGAWVHTDAAQSVGKVPVDLRALGVDFISVAGHKLYAPAGVGALIIRAGVELPTFMHGAGHESGRRAGTENVLEIVGLGEAAALAQASLEAAMPRARALLERLHERMQAAFGGTLAVNGPPLGAAADRLPNTLNVSFPGIEAPALLAEIGDRVCASAGAACHGGGVVGSHVLTAMGIDCDRAAGAVRFSVGRKTTEADIDAAVAIIRAAVG